MTNYTDTQFKQALAKLAPDKVKMGYMNPDLLYWTYNNIPYNEVRDTELLHLCWMVEQELTSKMGLSYFSCLEVLTQREAVSKDEQRWLIFLVLSASWQQRVIALAKVKGIEIV